MHRVIARKLYVNVSRLKVRHKHFCTDAATRVSGSNCGQPSPVILISPYIYLCVCENYEVNNLFHVNSLQWNPRIAIVLVFPMETSRVQSPVSPNYYIIKKKKKKKKSFQLKQYWPSSIGVSAYKLSNNKSTHPNSQSLKVCL